MCSSDLKPVQAIALNVETIGQWPVKLRPIQNIGVGNQAIADLGQGAGNG